MKNRRVMRMMVLVGMDADEDEANLPVEHWPLMFSYDDDDDDADEENHDYDDTLMMMMMILESVRQW